MRGFSLCLTALQFRHSTPLYVVRNRIYVLASMPFIAGLTVAAVAAVVAGTPPSPCC